MEYIITFESTSQAVQTERLLTDKGFKVRVMPLPSQINVGCGVCFRLEEQDLEGALRVLSDHQIGGIQVFQKTIVNKRTNYRLYPVNTQEEIEKDEE